MLAFAMKHSKKGFFGASKTWFSRKLTLIGLIVSLILLSGCGEEKCSGMAYSDALELAKNSECGKASEFEEEHSCNEITQTWWIEMKLEKELCNPACVVNAETRNAEINWRCTGEGHWLEQQEK